MNQRKVDSRFFKATNVKVFKTYMKLQYKIINNKIIIIITITITTIILITITVIIIIITKIN